jgi:hypothetical protein
MMFRLRLSGYAIAAAVFLVPSIRAQQVTNAAPSPGPQISVDGYTYTQQSLFQRNIGAPDDQTTQFPPHKIIGNIYYVGTGSLAVFLVATPQGNIIINSTFERNIPVILKSVEQLGLSFLIAKSCWAVTRMAITRKATRSSSKSLARRSWRWRRTSRRSRT